MRRFLQASCFFICKEAAVSSGYVGYNISLIFVTGLCFLGNFPIGFWLFWWFICKVLCFGTLKFADKKFGLSSFWCFICKFLCFETFFGFLNCGECDVYLCHSVSSIYFSNSDWCFRLHRWTFCAWECKVLCDPKQDMESHRCETFFFDNSNIKVCFMFLVTFVWWEKWAYMLVYQCDHAQELLVNASGNNSGLVVQFCKDNRNKCV